MSEDQARYEGDHGPLAVPSVIRTILLVLVALVALWFCVRAMLFHLWQERYPVIGQAVSPPSPVSEAIISLNRASAKNGVADPLARELLEDALRRAPLLADPFIVAGLDASARNAYGAAAGLMEEARRRNPRAIVPRYWLFDDYLRNGDYARGIAEAAPLIRLQPAAEPAVVAVLTALIQVPAARSALTATLRTHPGWSRAFFRQASAAPALRDSAAALLRTVNPTGEGAARIQRSDMRSMVAAGNYADAYAIWLSTLSANQRPSEPGLFDGGFDKPLGGAPFGWQLEAPDSAVQVVTARDAPSGSGLAIRIDGNRAAVIAEQLVRVEPGRLRLTFATRALSQLDTNNAGLKAELRCGAKGGTLASQIIETFAARLDSHTISVTPQRDCGAVLVRFSVVPGIEAGSLQALLTNIALSQGNRA